MDSIKDPSIKIKPSGKLNDFIVSNVNLQENVPKAIERISTGKCIEPEETDFLSLTDIRWLKEYILDDNSGGWLHEVIDNCDVVLPQPTKLPRNPELEARIQRLKREQQHQEYKSMTRNVDLSRGRIQDDNIGYQIRQINRQLIAVLQFVFSVVAGFFFGFIGLQLIVGNLEFGFRLLLGVICALVIALAEIYFLAKKLNEDASPPEWQTPSKSSKKKDHQE